MARVLLVPRSGVPISASFDNDIITTEVSGYINVKVGKHVTDQEPQGNVNVFNSNITIRADKLVLDKGTKINIGSVLNVKKNE